MKIAYLLLRVIFFAYLACCAFLFFYQRKILYLPPAQRLDAPPAGSSFRNQKVEVPGVGTITNWVTPAANADSPTVVFFHGNGSDRRDFMETGERLHRLGWGVVLASYPGYSGNSGTVGEANLMAAARATMEALGHPDGGVVLWGHSLGIGVAARMASEGRAKGLVLESPYTSIANVAAGRYWMFPVKLLIHDPYDTVSLLPAIKVPVLIVHNGGDQVVPFHMGKELAARFGTQAEFHPYPLRQSHAPHADEDMSGLVFDWWQRKVKARSMLAAAAPSQESAAGFGPGLSQAGMN